MSGLLLRRLRATALVLDNGRGLLAQIGALVFRIVRPHAAENEIGMLAAEPGVSPGFSVANDHEFSLFRAVLVSYFRGGNQALPAIDAPYGFPGDHVAVFSGGDDFGSPDDAAAKQRRGDDDKDDALQVEPSRP